RFGPRRDEYERVRGWFVARGFEVVRDSQFRVALVVAGTAAQVEAALGAPIGRFVRGGRTYHAPLAEPSLPASIAASVRGMVGLDDLPKFRPLAISPGGDTALVPSDFATAYGVKSLQTAGLTGAGHSIAVIARSNFADGDVASFSTNFLSFQLAPVRVFAGADPGISTDEGERIEVSLDTEWAGSLAPGATLNIVIGSQSGNIPEALITAIENRASGAPSGDVITISFGLCEQAAPVVTNELFDAFYAIANAQGQTVLVAAGDDGGRACLPQSSAAAVNGLASSPHVVAVGGTSFALNPDGSVPPPATLVEKVWEDSGGAGGGGQSIVFAMPRYQIAAGLGGLSSGRAVPDLAVAASPVDPGYVVVEGGVGLIVGGTSAGTPAMASALALVNQRLEQTHGVTGGLGQLLPDLYRVASEQVRGVGPAVFRDVVTGSNGAFVAGPGFDLASGWGAPLVDALAGTLEGPGPCEPDLVCMVPNGRGGRSCAGEWLVEQELFLVRRNHLPAPRQTCRDGDPQCDADGAADGHCTLRVALCLNVFDSRGPLLHARGPNKGLPLCRPGTVHGARLLAPRASRRDPTANANHMSLADTIGALPLPTGLDAACTATVPVIVPVNGHVTLRAQVADARGPVTPRVTLRCTP
ncbi:MAG TPA: S53 family peptidase, partial [Verrucomicrobiae bacterium]|nr:S53 family peptidase [Verrucomicrobiae bacterium]